MPLITAARTPKYIVLADQLREQIEQGVLKPGDRLPSFAEVRDRHGVTSGTVDRIYTHLETAGLVVREQGRGIFVKQRGEVPATGVIGLSGPPLGQHPYALQLMEGFQEISRPAGLEILLLAEGAPVPRGKVDGVVFYDTSFAKRELWKLLPPGLPCVSTLVGARNHVGVVADEYQGSYDLTQYLLALGHRRIGYIYDPYLPPRLAGFRDAMRDAEIKIDQSLMRHVSIRHTPELSYTSVGHAVMSSWLQEEKDWLALGCTALLTQNDDTAIGVVRALNKAGLRVPEDVSVAGFDSTEIGRYFVPPLTSVEVPLREIGATAMDLLLRQIRGESVRASTITLPAHVFGGESVAKVGS